MHQQRGQSRARVLALVAGGMPVRQAAREVGVGDSSASWWVQEARLEAQLRREREGCHG
jgi:transposase